MKEIVTIVGAGLSGLACAIALARAGWNVVVHEWHRNVGARFHGDFQGLENWSDEQDVFDELHVGGIKPTFENHPVRHGVAFDYACRKFQIQSARPLYYLVRRGATEGCLDYDLQKQAANLGVEIRFDSRVQRLSNSAVLATGPRVADAIAVGYVFNSQMPNGSWLALSNRLAPLGYSYLLVYEGRGTVASCMFRGFKNQAEHVRQTITFFREHAGLEMEEPRPFGGFANFRLSRTALQGGHPVIGEQAGFQDALAGFGIRYALRSGLLAAQSLINGQDYTKLWQSKFLPLLRTSVVNRFLYNIVGHRGWSVALKKLSKGDSGVALRQLYQPSALTRLLFPIARFNYRIALRDSSCNHVNCEYIWCRHQIEKRNNHVVDQSS